MFQTTNQKHSMGKTPKIHEHYNFPWHNRYSWSTWRLNQDIQVPLRQESVYVVIHASLKIKTQNQQIKSNLSEYVHAIVYVYMLATSFFSVEPNHLDDVGTTRVLRAWVGKPKES